jgi:hypothetical protein
MGNEPRNDGRDRRHAECSQNVYDPIILRSPGGSLHRPSSPKPCSFPGAVRAVPRWRAKLGLVPSMPRSIKRLDDTQGGSELLQDDRLSYVVGFCDHARRLLGC